MPDTATATGLLAVGCLAAYTYSQLRAQQRRIDSLTLQLLALSTRDIQTLSGASARKDWLKAHPEHEAWAKGLLDVQEANALAAPPRPAGATRKLLYDGAEQNKLDVVAKGLAQGYDPNHEHELHPKFGTTPLMEAAFHGRDDIVKLLIEHNAALNTQSGYGWTALHYAGQANKPGCAALLVAAGADREIKNSKGKTALARAQEQAQEKPEKQAIVDLLG